MHTKYRSCEYDFSRADVHLYKNMHTLCMNVDHNKDLVICTFEVLVYVHYQVHITRGCGSCNTFVPS